MLPLLSKVLERHVFDELYNYSSSNNLFTSNHSGFRKNHSCQSLLIKITDFLLGSIDNGKISWLTMIDLRKAFDLVSHEIILNKLQMYGLDNKAMDWFGSYLEDRIIRK